MDLFWYLAKLIQLCKVPVSFLVEFHEQRMLPTNRAQSGRNQKGHDADPRWPHHQPIRTMSTSCWHTTQPTSLSLQNLLWNLLLIEEFHYFLNSTKARTSASVILRGANDFMCDEMERSLHDALCVVKRVLESKSVVPGGGAVEAALSIYLENYATSMVRTPWSLFWFISCCFGFSFFCEDTSLSFLLGLQ